LPEAERQGDRGEGGEAVTLPGGEEGAGPLAPERLDFGPLGPGWRDEPGDVPGDEAPAALVIHRIASLRPNASDSHIPTLGAFLS